MLQSDNSKILIANNRTMHQLKNVNPKFAKHMLLKNSLVERFAMEELGSMDILEHPMCNKCEKPGTWHKDDTCFHMECGTITKNPITVRKYILEQLKMPEEMLELIEQYSYGEKGEIVDEGFIIK